MDVTLCVNQTQALISASSNPICFILSALSWGNKLHDISESAEVFLNSVCLSLCEFPNINFRKRKWGDRWVLCVVKSSSSRYRRKPTLWKKGHNFGSVHLKFDLTCFGQMMTSGQVHLNLFFLTHCNDYANWKLKKMCPSKLGAVTV